MTKTLEFLFDFGSPNAYLAHKVLPALVARTGVNLITTPCLIGGIFKATNNKSPIVQYAEIPAKLAYERLEMRRFIQAHGLHKFKMNPHFPVNTLLIMRGAMVALQLGRLEAYTDIMFNGMWEDGLNLADSDVVIETLSQHAFDGKALVAQTADPVIKDQLAANTQAAVTRSVFGLPTFFVGEAMFFGKERLGQVEAALCA